jgi:YD repeat-containing protein
MPLLRQPGRNPLARTIARVLILALVAGLTPIEARAARTTTFAEPSLPRPHERECPVRVDVWIFLVVGLESVTKDPVGNRLSQTTTLGPAGSAGPQLQPGTVGYGYDERDRLLTEQLQPNPATAYAWDANGNLLTKDGEATYTWDHENRLVRVTKTDGTVVEHAYDADGNRVRTTTTPAPVGGSPQPPTITDFLVDTSGPLSHVVAETDGAAAPGAPGSLKAYYVRGDDLLAVMRPLVAAPAPATPADWQTRYYHADGLGSIRRLTDEAGNITDGYSLTVFGELIGYSGTDPQPYLFAGEPYDPNSGFQYHRARWYAPGARGVLPGWIRGRASSSSLPRCTSTSMPRRTRPTRWIRRDGSSSFPPRSRPWLGLSPSPFPTSARVSRQPFHRVARFWGSCSRISAATRRPQDSRSFSTISGFDPAFRSCPSSSRVRG